MRCIVPLVYYGAMPARSARRRIGAVVRNDIYACQPCVVALIADAVNQLADYSLLVPRCDEHGKAMLWRRAYCTERVWALFARQPRDGYVQKLIYIAREEQTHDYVVYHFNGMHDTAPHFLSLATA